jgi:hypothetical protein
MRVICQDQHNVPVFGDQSVDVGTHASTSLEVIKVVSAGQKNQNRHAQARAASSPCTTQHMRGACCCCCSCCMGEFVLSSLLWSAKSIHSRMTCNKCSQGQDTYVPSPGMDLDILVVVSIVDPLPYEEPKNQTQTQTQTQVYLTSAYLAQ